MNEYMPTQKRWEDYPAVIDIETIAQESGSTVERHELRQVSLKRDILTKVPELGGKFFSDELILMWFPLCYEISRKKKILWDIVLTNKRVCWRYTDGTDNFTSNIFYKEIVDIKPEWNGDLGSHIAGGGGYVYGYAWEGMGNTWGTQNPIVTIKHHVECRIHVSDTRTSHTFPVLNIFTQEYLDETKKFIDILNNLVNRAWKRDEARKTVMADSDKAIKLDPQNAVLYKNRGDAYVSNKQYDLAIADLNKAIELDPKLAAELNLELAKAYQSRAQKYMDKGQYDLVIADLNKVIELDPRNASAYTERGSAHNKKEMYDLAIADSNKAIELDPLNARSFNNRGFSYSGKGLYDLAIADYNKAIELNPQYSFPYLNRGYLYKEKGQYDLAIADFNKAIGLNPQYALTYAARGTTYNKKRQRKTKIQLYNQALADLNKAIELDPQNASFYKLRGNLLNSFWGNGPIALKDFNKAYELDPANHKPYKLVFASRSKPTAVNTAELIIGIALLACGCYYYSAGSLLIIFGGMLSFVGLCMTLIGLFGKGRKAVPQRKGA